LIALVIKPFLKAKVIVSERNNPYLNETNTIVKFLNHSLYRIADQLVLQTSAIVASFPEHLHHKITVIPNPVLKPKVEKLEYDSIKNEYNIISIGRLKKQKGYDFLIKVFASLGQLSRNWSLTILGEGEERSALESLCRSMQIETKVQLVGNHQKPEFMMKDADMYVLSSRFEGFPNSLCEAMSVGLPCIATSCPFGPSEIIEDGVNGLLVDVENEEELRLAMSKLMHSKELREHLGVEAKKISDRLSLSNVMLQWEKIVKDSNGIKQ
jgi:glycosyltransferase involved in cell wall biosynthesis